MPLNAQFTWHIYLHICLTREHPQKGQFVRWLDRSTLLQLSIKDVLNWEQSFHSYLHNIIDT